MVSTNALQEILFQAIQEYDFPSVTFDFRQTCEIKHSSIKNVEAEIRHQLLVDDLRVIKDGLSNVLYWGYARIGYRSERVKRFREKVTEQQLACAKQEFQHILGPGVKQIAKLGLPEFSGLSFVSKIRMFLDPKNYVVLDRQLLKLREQNPMDLFQEIRMTPKQNQIRITKKTETVYEQWSGICRHIATTHFSHMDIRAVDIERGTFFLVQSRRVRDAVEILANLSGCA